MNKNYYFILGSLLGAAAPACAATITAQTAFSTDGFLSPAENSFLAAGDHTRGMAYNPATNSLVVVSRVGGTGSGIIISSTGNQTGTLNTTGITGGAIILGPLGIDDAGVLYASNVASPVSGASAVKVYRWADQNAAPTVAFTSTNVTAGRLGDNIAVTGSGISTKVALGESNSTGTGLRHSFAVLSTLDGSAFTGQLVTFNAPSAIPPVSSFQRGITFLDSDTVVGAIGAANGNMTIADFTSLAVGTVVDTNPQTSGSERLMDITTIAGINYLATLDSSNSTVRVYNFSDPLNPFVEATATFTGTVANGNGSGGVSWGPVTADSATLYALNTNTGIFAYTFQVPEPSVAMLGLAGLGVLLNRRRK